MSQVLSLPPIQTYRPATFLERGVAVPFTTPLLTGARARPGARSKVELVVRNPSGGRGYYIVPMCQRPRAVPPTVHDSRLNRLISSLPSPDTFHRAAGRLGNCGPGTGGQASDGSRAGSTRRRTARIRSARNTCSWERLPNRPARMRSKASIGGAIRRWRSSGRRNGSSRNLPGRRTSRRMASRAHLKALAEIFAPIGVDRRNSTEARLPRLLKEITAMHAALDRTHARAVRRCPVRTHRYGGVARRADHGGFGKGPRRPRKR